MSAVSGAVVPTAWQWAAERVMKSVLARAGTASASHETANGASQRARVAVVNMFKGIPPGKRCVSERAICVTLQAT